MTTQEVLQGIHDWTNGKIVYDISEHNPTGGPNSDGKFTLEYILSNANTLIPASVRKGGMSIKFVHTSDNKYLQFRCMAQNFTTDVTQWQGVDNFPVVGSKNLAESGTARTYYQRFIPIYLNDVVIDGTENTQGKLFESKSVRFTSTSGSWQNLIYEVRNIKEGHRLYFRVNRNNVPSRLRIICYDTNDNSHVIQETGYVDSDVVSIIVPTGTLYIRVIFYVAWGTAISSGTTYTFDKFEIYYENFYQKACLSQRGSIIIDYDNDNLTINTGNIRVSKDKVIELTNAVTLPLFANGSSQTIIFSVVSNTFSAKAWNYLPSENEILVGCIQVNRQDRTAYSNDFYIENDSRVELLKKFTAEHLTNNTLPSNIVDSSDYNRIIACDTIKVTSSNNVLQNLNYNIYYPITNKCLNFKVNRGAQNARLRILCFDDVSSTASVHIVADTGQVNLDNISIFVPSGTKRIQCLIYIAWGTAIEADTEFTFTDYEISYTTATIDIGILRIPGITVDLYKKTVTFKNGSIFDIKKGHVIETTTKTCDLITNAGSQVVVFNRNTSDYSIISWAAAIPENCMYVGTFIVDWSAHTINSCDIAILNADTAYLWLPAGITDVSYNGIKNNDYKSIFFNNSLQLISTSGVWQDVHHDMLYPLTNRKCYFSVKNPNSHHVKLRILCYDGNPGDINHIIADASVIDEEKVELFIPENTKSIRVVIYIAWGTAITEDVTYTFNKIDFGYCVDERFGDYIYYGDSPINIKPITQNFYNKTKLMTKNYSSSAVNVDYRRQQTMALWGNYLFCLEDNADNTGHCQIFEFDTLSNSSEPICSMSIAGRHANSAEFTNVYYDNDDEFPLLLISYFYPGTKAGLFRIVRDGTNFSATLIKEIVLSGSKFALADSYGSSFTINYVTNTLYAFIPQERWNDYFYKPVLAYSFQLSDILETSGDITLTESDIKQSYEVPWFILQSILVVNGLIYIPCSAPVASPFMGYTGNIMIVVDPNGFVVKNIVPLNNTLEPEGLIVSGNDLCISFRRSTAPDGSLAFEIEKYTFN